VKPARRSATVLALLLLAAGQEPVAKLKLISLVHNDVSASEATAPASIARYDLPRNRLIFNQHEIHIAIQAGFDFEDQIFLINGLLNPDIQVPRGATLAITLAAMRSPASFVIAPRPPAAGEVSTVDARPRDPAPIRPDFGDRIAFAPPRRLSSPTIEIVTVTYLAEKAGTLYWSNGKWPEGCYGRIIVVP